MMFQSLQITLFHLTVNMQNPFTQITNIVHTKFGHIFISMNRKSRHEHKIPLEDGILLDYDNDKELFIFKEEFKTWLTSRNIIHFPKDYSLYYDGKIIHFGFNGSQELRTEFYLKWGKQ